MIFTNEAHPQVKVTVDDLPALCTGLACDYVHTEPTGQVTAMALGDLNPLDITITGTDLPLDLVSVTLAKTDCVVSSNDGSQIVCALATPWVAGSWVPEVRDAAGLIPVSDAVAAHTVPLVVTGVAPDLDLNQAGGDILAITGEGFPSTLEGHDLKFRFSDGTDCIPFETTATEVKCVTRPFAPETRRRLQIDQATLEMLLRAIYALAAGGETESTTVPAWLDPTVYSVTTVTPAVASPILTTTITLMLNPTYPAETMATDTFSVALVPRDPDLTRPNGEAARPLNVVAYDDTNGAPSITVKYGGAYSGVYDWTVSSAANGDLVTRDVQFEAKIAVTGFYPTQGSLYGGTLVTITGGHFSDLTTDNPVKIGYNYLSGVDHYCYVESTSQGDNPETYATDGVITCRTAVDYAREAGEEELVVFASTFEEAVCEFSDIPDCMFTFLDSS